MAKSFNDVMKPQMQVSTANDSFSRLSPHSIKLAHDQYHITHLQNRNKADFILQVETPKYLSVSKSTMLARNLLAVISESPANSRTESKSCILVPQL